MHRGIMKYSSVGIPFAKTIITSPMRGFNHPSNSYLPFTPKQRKLPVIHIFIKLFILLGPMQMNYAEILADQKKE